MNYKTKEKLWKLKSRMKLIQVWKAGFTDCQNGHNFSMNPYPTPSSTCYGYDNDRNKRKYWTMGYWAADKLIKSKKVAA